MGISDGTPGDLELIIGDLQTLTRCFNIVLVAEGYSASAQAKFVADTEAVAKRIALAAPFRSHLHSLNLLRLPVVSVEDGADHGPTAARTYFDAAFPGTVPGSPLPPQLLLVDELLVLETVRQRFEALVRSLGEEPRAPHKIIVLCNTDHYGGSGGAGDGIAVTTPFDGFGTLLHELGHTFGLVDEYPAGGALGGNLWHTAAKLPWEKLATTAVRPTIVLPDQPPLPYSTVGAFADPALPERYRPQWVCRMRHTGHDAFCAVCAALVGRQLGPLTA